jgi:hypothetical protein
MTSPAPSSTATFTCLCGETSGGRGHASSEVRFLVQPSRGADKECQFRRAENPTEARRARYAIDGPHFCAAPAHSPKMAKQLRCTLRWHMWKRMTNDDNQVYRACSRCGKGDDDYFPPGNAVTF